MWIKGLGSFSHLGGGGFSHFQSLLFYGQESFSPCGGQPQALRASGVPQCYL